MSGTKTLQKYGVFHERRAQEAVRARTQIQCVRATFPGKRSPKLSFLKKSNFSHSLVVLVLSKKKKKDRL